MIGIEMKGPAVRLTGAKAIPLQQVTAAYPYRGESIYYPEKSTSLYTKPAALRRNQPSLMLPPMKDNVPLTMTYQPTKLSGYTHDKFGNRLDELVSLGPLGISPLSITREGGGWGFNPVAWLAAVLSGEQIMTRWEAEIRMGMEHGEILKVSRVSPEKLWGWR